MRGPEGDVRGRDGGGASGSTSPTGRRSRGPRGRRGRPGTRTRSRTRGGVGDRGPSRSSGSRRPASAVDVEQVDADRLVDVPVEVEGDGGVGSGGVSFIGCSFGRAAARMRPPESMIRERADAPLLRASVARLLSFLAMLGTAAMAARCSMPSGCSTVRVGLRPHRRPRRRRRRARSPRAGWGLTVHRRRQRRSGSCSAPPTSPRSATRAATRRRRWIARHRLQRAHACARPRSRGRSSGRARRARRPTAAASALLRRVLRRGRWWSTRSPRDLMERLVPDDLVALRPSTSPRPTTRHPGPRPARPLGDTAPRDRRSATPLTLDDLDGCFTGVVPVGHRDRRRPTGVPNVTYLSRAHPVDDERIALSNQFLSKSSRNLAENPGPACSSCGPRPTRSTGSTVGLRAHRAPGPGLRPAPQRPLDDRRAHRDAGRLPAAVGRRLPRRRTSSSSAGRGRRGLAPLGPAPRRWLRRPAASSASCAPG